MKVLLLAFREHVLPTPLLCLHACLVEAQELCTSLLLCRQDFGCSIDACWQTISFADHVRYNLFVSCFLPRSSWWFGRGKSLLSSRKVVCVLGRLLWLQGGGSGISPLMLAFTSSGSFLTVVLEHFLDCRSDHLLQFLVKCRLTL